MKAFQMVEWQKPGESPGSACSRTRAGAGPGEDRRRRRMSFRPSYSTTLQMAAQMARVLGHLTIVGLGGGALPVNFFSPPHECSVASPFWGSIPELMEVVSLAEAGRIQMLVEHFPLDRASEAYHLL